MKKEVKVILIIIASILIQTIMYYFAKIIQGEPNILGSNIDNYIKFNVLGIIPYCIWYFLTLLIPLYIFKKEKYLFINYIVSYFLTAIIADIIFVIYPTAVIRPEIVGNGILYSLTKLIYMIDSDSINCFPSLHCAVAALWTLYIFKCKDTKIVLKISVLITSILIILSTMLIKQHVFIDFISGVVLAIVVFLITNLLKEKILKLNKYLKL